MIYRRNVREQMRVKVCGIDGHCDAAMMMLVES